MTTHESYLELAAGALDFDLSDAERSVLDEHLRSCGSCRHRASRMATDIPASAGNQAFHLSEAGYHRINERLRSPGRSPLGTLRLVAIAVLIAIAALGAVQVGAQLIERLVSERNGLIVDAALPTTPISSPFAPPSASPVVGRFAAGSMVEVVAGGLRVRTAPTVDNATSAKFDPLLAAGAQLRVVDGPVFADDYEWYLVEVIGSPQRGWVSSADHDGTPWVADPNASSPEPTALTDKERALVLALRPDARIRCEHRGEALPARAIAGIECRLRTSLVTSVRAYQYGKPADTLATYVERMASDGVARLGGDCSTSTSGDETWQSAHGGAGASGRIGCFLDANGSTNIRLTCGRVACGSSGEPTPCRPCGTGHGGNRRVGSETCRGSAAPIERVAAHETIDTHKSPGPTGHGQTKAPPVAGRGLRAYAGLAD